MNSRSHSGFRLGSALVPRAGRSMIDLLRAGASVSPHDGLSVSRPSDVAEVEAARIADTLPASRASIGQKPTIARAGVNTRVAPQVQRDLTGLRKSLDGEFDLNLRTESHQNAK